MPGKTTEALGDLADNIRHFQFKLTDEFIANYIGKHPNWGALGYVTYKRTYARRVENENRLEDWWETIKRVVEGCYTFQKWHCDRLGLPWNPWKAQKSAQRMYELIFNMKFLPPGRGLWAMGTELVYKLGSAPISNCAFVSTKEIDVDFSGPFTFLMDMSMLGVGVGGDTKGAGLVTIKSPKTTDAPYIVEDSRKGWVDLVGLVLDSFIGKETLPTNIDYSQVRPKGAPIKTFGGIAAGPEPLIECIVSLVKLLTPKNGEPYKITTPQIVDIFNYIGKAVVSGNVRRSAELMLGFPDDESFLNLKLDKKALADRRWASNNSVFAHVGMNYGPMIERTIQNGEPGYFWIDIARHYGRLKDGYGNHDVMVEGANPCVEQSLESYEMCNLVELNPSAHESYEEFRETCKYAYLYAKTVTLIPSHNPRTNAVMLRNRRIGLSQTGIIAAIQKFGLRNYLTSCDKAYEHVCALDDQYSNWLCVPKSNKKTTVKPSGTVSKLMGVPPGIHWPEAEHYIQRIRFADNSPLLDDLNKAGYKIVKDVYADHTMVVEFPMKEKNFLKGKADISVWEQVQLHSLIQECWSDNQVSQTVTFKAHEASEISSILQYYEGKLKAISFLPLSEHGYELAPLEAITKEEYTKLAKKIKPLKGLSITENEVVEKYCTTDACEIPMAARK